MEDDYQLIHSPLSRTVTEGGQTVRIEIYRGPDSKWILEAVDIFDNSTVWDDEFASDQEALDEGLRTIRDEGISSLVGAVN